MATRLQERCSDIMNRKTLAMLGVLALLGLLLLAACSKKNTSEEQSSSPTSESQPPTASTPIDPSTAATVSGTVKFDGTAPKPPKIDMSQDPACKGDNTAETLAVKDGDLDNVFVYVKNGLGKRSFAVPKDSVVRDQKGCPYDPHLLAVMAGQSVESTDDAR